MTFPLIWIGALVTTEDAGMAVPDWPTTFGYNMFAFPIPQWLTGPWDLFIEHGHRLLAATVGLVTIALSLLLWINEKRTWMRWLGLAALALVILQGVLGGMRVVLSDVQLAKLHGCTGPLFFLLAVAIAVFTSRFWNEPSRLPTRVMASLQRQAWFVVGVVYMQLVVGANVRHISPLAGPETFRIAVMFHLLLAMLVVVATFVLFQSVWRNARQERKLAAPALLAMLFVLCQLGLGSLTWVVKYGFPEFAINLLGLSETAWAVGWTNAAGNFTASLVITAHVATGSLILVLAAMVGLRAGRPAVGHLPMPRIQMNLMGVAL